jgi:peptide/nickel transport system substrate-binding protein
MARSPNESTGSGRNLSHAHDETNFSIIERSKHELRWEANMTQGQRLVPRREVLIGTAALAAVAGPGLPGVAYGQPSAPKPGGTFKTALTGGSTSDTFDPRLYNSVFTNILGATFGNCLLEIDNNNKLVPELADSWESSKDLRTWRFKLRKGIQFHNGKTLEPADVAYSLNLHRGKNNKSAMASVMRAVTDIQADGQYIVVTLEAGNADFHWNLSDLHTVIVPAGVTDFTRAIGTGPYEVVTFEPGVRLVAKRNPNYWKQGRAHFEQVELLSMGDATTRMNALLTSAVDAINQIDVQVAGRLEGNSRFQILNVTGYRHGTFPMRVDIPPFDNEDVRLAIKYAMNRQEILDRIFRHYGTLGNDNPISPIQQFYTKLPQHEYDPDKAKFYLKRAGHSRLSVTLQTADVAFNGAVDACLLFKQQAAACGIDINVERMSNDGYFTKIWLVSPWCVSYWSGRPTCDQIFTLGYAAGAPWNECKWNNPDFNKLLVAARVEPDQAKRQEMYTEMQRVVSDDDGNLIPIFMNYVFARQGHVRSSPQIAGNYDMDGYRLLERWWFA